MFGKKDPEKSKLNTNLKTTLKVMETHVQNLVDDVEWHRKTIAANELKIIALKETIIHLKGM